MVMSINELLSFFPQYQGKSVPTLARPMVLLQGQAQTEMSEAALQSQTH